MKFKKFGKALLLSALSAGVALGVTSCVQSYTVGFLYVTGTVTSGSAGNGIISGFKIDHNTGRLTPINGLPVASGGANPVRAVLLTSNGSRFLYVLNRGANASGGSDCTTADPCQDANITQFAVGANGILTAQETFTTQGLNPFRLLTDSSGSYLYVLDHDSIGQDGVNPSSASNPNPNCAAALSDGSGTPITVCADITAFKIDPSTGRLQLVTDAQASSTLNKTVSYFPVPANPVDFVMDSSDILTLSGTSATASSDYPYTGGATVYPYAYVSTSGQLTTTATQYPGNVLNIAKGTALVTGSGYLFVLDNEPGSTSSLSQILPYTLGTNGALLAATSGPIPDDPTQSNPIMLMVENKGKWFYVANQGNNVTGTGTAESGIAGYLINSPFQPTETTEISAATNGFGTGSNPQCLVEDPSNQFFYEANMSDSTVTGQSLDPNSGDLVPLSQNTKVPSEYSLTGEPTWCLVDGRTD